MLGVFILGLKPILSAPFPMVKPLLDEMFASCLSYQPDPNVPDRLRGAGTPIIKPVGPLMEVDIEEVATRVFLRNAIFELHTGFSPAAMISQSFQQVLMVAASLRTQTSPEPSAQSSPEAPEPSES